MDAREEERGAQSEFRHLVAMRPGNPLDKTMQAQPPQIVGHAAPGEEGGRLPGERGEVLAQIAMSETAGQETEQNQGGPQSQHLRIGEAQC